MREAINSNPMVQAAVIGVLLLGAVFFFVSSSGGKEEESAAPESTLSVSETEPGTPAGEATAGQAVASEASVAGALAAAGAPPLPRAVVAAYRANSTIVLVIVRDGGIDDRIVRNASAGLAGFRDAAVFVVPARQISRYAAITEGVGVERVPALVVVTPKHLDESIPSGSVSYGFQSPQSVAQAVIDAGYEGPTVSYHP
jgi:hypothetical protein